jgi:hypothetical protein
MIKKSSTLLHVALPVFIAIMMLNAYKKNIRPSTDIGLGEATSSCTPSYEDFPIHIRYPVKADSLKDGWMKRGKKEVSLWIGNSQLHGVNQFEPGNSNCIGFLFDKLLPYRCEVLGISFPNANLQEFLVSVIYFSKLIPAKRIILPIFYDDMREDGIRAILQGSSIADSIRTSSFYFSHLENIKSLCKPSEAKLVQLPDDYSGIKETTQDISERYVNHFLEARWKIWKMRPDIRGKMYNDLYNIRNILLGIDASTIRKMIPGRYQENHKAFLAILDYCNDKGIELTIYIPPIRNDVPLPYEMEGYNKFKQVILEECNSKGVRFLNLESLIPKRCWGVSGTSDIKSRGSIDFMHFREEGHRIIADTIFKIITGKQSDF